MRRRNLVLAAGWLLAVVLAAGVGVVGIGLVGAGLTSGQGSPLDEEQVERELTALGSPPPAPARSSSAAPVVSGRSFSTRGGTVVADCSRILSMAPAQGWSVREQEDDEGEFQSVDDPLASVEVELECVAGRPELTVTGA